MGIIFILCLSCIISACEGSEFSPHTIPPVEQCINIGGVPYFITGKANNNPIDYTYKVQSKYRYKSEYKGKSKRNAFTLKVHSTIADFFKPSSLALENDKEVKEENELLKLMKKNKKLKDHAINSEILYLDSAKKRDLVLIKDYIDPKKFYTINDFMASNKDSAAEALRVALGTLLDLLCKISAEGIVVNKLDTFNMIIFHDDKTGSISSNAKLKLTSGLLEEKGVDPKVALMKNLGNLKKRWAYKGNKIKAQGIENCKLSNSTFAPKSSLDESTKGVLQDFHVTMSVMLCDLDTFVDPKGCNNNARQLFYAQLDGTEPKYIKSKKEPQEEEEEVEQDREEEGELEEDNEDEDEEVEETPVTTTIKTRSYTKNIRKNNGKSDKAMDEIKRLVDSLADNQKEIAVNASKIADQAQGRADLERERARLEKEKSKLLKKINQSIKDANLKGSSKKVIKTRIKNITTEEEED